MRCTNCGWNNPEGLSKCQKCNQPLPESQSSDTVGSQLSSGGLSSLAPSSSPANLTATIRDVSRYISEPVTESLKPAEVPAPQLVHSQDTEARKATVRDFRTQMTSSYRLVPVDGEGSVVVIDGDVTVGRQQIEPSNPAIDVEQFVASSDGVKLTIRDVSKLGNTFVQARKDTVLEKGDVILVGNRRYLVD